MINKDVRNLISEAFDELYKELINEAPLTKLKTKILDDEVESIIQTSKERGTPVPNKFRSDEDPKSRENFDIIIDALVSDYKETGNPNSKAAIQGTYYPSHGSQLQRAIAGPYLRNSELDDAAASAYEQIVINYFDKAINEYEPGSRGFGGLLTSLMSGRVKNYMKGYRGDGSGAGMDAFKGQSGNLSIDAPVGDEKGGSTFVDKLSIGPESSEERGMSQEKSTTKIRQVIDDAIAWLDNTFDEDNNEMGKKRMIAFKGLLNGDTSQDIADEYPEYFDAARPGLVKQEADRLINSLEAKEISKMISQAHGINFNLADIDYNKLVQTYSMGSNFGGSSTTMKQSTPEIEGAQKILNNALAAVGLDRYAFDSNRKRAEVTADLESRGLNDELEKILDADEDLEIAKKTAKDKGEYDVKTTSLPTSQNDPNLKFNNFMSKLGVDSSEYKNWEVLGGDEENKFGKLGDVAKKHNLSAKQIKTMYELAQDVYRYSYGGMFEGFDMDKLMERVYKRLTS